MYNKEIDTFYFPMKYDSTIVQLLEKSEQLKKEGDFEKAIQILQKIILENAECIEAYEELGDNYLSLRELDKAEKALMQALKLNNASANAHYLLGFLFSLQQKWYKSVEELLIADKIFSNHSEILRCLGWSLYNSNRWGQGIAILERSHTLNPQDANILCDLGVCYMSSTHYKEAKKTFESVIRLNPVSDQARECIRFLKMLDTKSCVL